MAWTAITSNLIVIVTSPTEFLSSLNVKVNYLLRMLSAQIYNILPVSSVVLFVKQHNYATWALTMQKLQWNFSLHLRQTVLLVSPQRQERTLQQYMIQKAVEEQRQDWGTSSPLPLHSTALYAFHPTVFSTTLPIWRTVSTAFFTTTVFIRHNSCHNKVHRLNLT